MTVTDDDIASLITEELLNRRTKVMYLRNAGATLGAIAAEVGVSVTTVRKDLEIVRRDINNEQPMDVVARHRAVIFDIQRANYPAMMRGDKDAAATILRALERESKLLGLDSPTRVLAAVSADDFANEAARLIESITAKDIDTLKELTTSAHPHVEQPIDAEEVPLPAAPAAAPEPVGRRSPFDRKRGHRAVDAGRVGEAAPDAQPDAVAGGDAPAARPEPDVRGGADGIPGPAGEPGHGQAPDQLPDSDDDWSNL